MTAAAPPAAAGGRRRSAREALGVTIEAQYTVGEYDILILSAQQSAGLETWLRENGYKIPAGASAVLGSYIKQNMKFFVAKVNLDGAGEAGLHVPAPAPGRLRVAEVHAADPPRHGQRQRTAGALRLRADAQGPRRDHELPHGEAADRHGGPGVREGASSPTSTRRCSTSRCRRRSMQRVFTRVRLGHELVRSVRRRPAVERGAAAARRLLARRATEPIARRDRPPASEPDVFLTRLHVRYDNAHFPEDLVFQETARPHELPGPLRAAPRVDGRRAAPRRPPIGPSLTERRDQEAQQLARLTGWPSTDIRRKKGLPRSELPVVPNRVVGAHLEEVIKGAADGPGRPTRNVSASTPPISSSHAGARLATSRPGSASSASTVRSCSARRRRSIHTGRARELADALYAELYGVRNRGDRRSLFRYFDGRSSLATWLRAVLAQRYVDRLRAERRLEPLPDEEMPAESDDADPERARYVAARRAGARARHL